MSSSIILERSIGDARDIRSSSHMYHPTGQEDISEQNREEEVQDTEDRELINDVNDSSILTSDHIESYPSIIHDEYDDECVQDDAVMAFLHDQPIVVEATSAVAVKSEDVLIVEAKKNIFKFIFTGAICVVIVIVAVMVPLSLTVFKPPIPVKIITHEPTPSPSVQPSAFRTYSPTTASYTKYVDYLVSSLTVSASSSYHNATELMRTRETPQHKALEWLFYKDDHLPGGNSQPSNGDDRVVRQRFVQRYVLAVFYFSTSGDGWYSCFAGDTNYCLARGRNNKSWLFDSECAWFGVSCNDDGWVTSIIFFSNNNKTALGNNLIGTISEELSELTNLTRFILRFNEELTHVIPKSFEYLSNLSILSLSYNGLHDNLDMTFLTNLTKLTILDLSNNNFQKHIPPFFGTFAKIERLSLNSNFLTGSLPSELGKLSKLIKLDISDNFLTGTVPGSFGINLKDLDLSKNDLTGEITFCDSVNKLDKYTVSIDCDELKCNCCDC